MNEEGLAASGQQMDPQMIEQVKQALMQGATPEELMAQGVPEEVIQMAIQALQQEQAQQQGAMTPAGQEMAGAGLAQSGM